MASVTVRIGEQSHKALREIAKRSGESMQTILAHAIEAYRRERFLEHANAALRHCATTRKRGAESRRSGRNGMRPFAIRRRTIDDTRAEPRRDMARRSQSDKGSRANGYKTRLCYR